MEVKLFHAHSSMETMTRARQVERKNWLIDEKYVTDLARPTRKPMEVKPTRHISTTNPTSIPPNPAWNQPNYHFSNPTNPSPLNPTQNQTSPTTNYQPNPTHNLNEICPQVPTKSTHPNSQSTTLSLPRDIDNLSASSLTFRRDSNFRRLFDKKYQRKVEKGFYFNCDKKFSPSTVVNLDSSE